MSERLDTHHRALRVNLDPDTFGTFAEIGAGQEVARWFLQVGGAAGTVAKTISAYDMKFSDEIYGKGSRYVSRDRLLAMLEHEYALLIERLDAERGEKTRFFVFADTVSARNFAGTNECHGWMGLRFQLAPRAEPHDILLHVNMQDRTNLLQQQALGILGVNLVHGAFFESESPETFLAGLTSELSLERIEIDVIELRGPVFAGSDPRRIGVRLVHEGLAQSVLFRPDGTLAQPSELLRKRPVVVERGLFERVVPLQRRMLELASARLRQEIETEREPLLLPELTVVPVSGREAPGETETLRRVSAVLECETPLLLTRFPEVYHLTSYLRRYTREPLRFVLGSSTVVQVLLEAHYRSLMGGLLEALGRLLAENVKLYVYPMEADTFWRLLASSGVARGLVGAPETGWVTARTIRPGPPLGHLYEYLLDAGWIAGLDPPAPGDGP